MESSKRRKIELADGVEEAAYRGTKWAGDEDLESAPPGFLSDSSMASNFLFYCDFRSLLAIRSVCRTLKLLSEEELIQRALGQLPIVCEIMRGERYTSVHLRKGWSDADHGSREALIEKTLRAINIDTNQEERARYLLLSTGWADAKDFVPSNNDIDENDDKGSDDDTYSSCDAYRSSYTQTLYEDYTNYDENGFGWGAAVIFEETVDVERAHEIMEAMLTRVRRQRGDDEEKRHGSSGHQSFESKLHALRQCALVLMTIHEESSLFHGYEAHALRHPEYPTCGQSGALQFVGPGDQEFELCFHSGFAIS